MNELKVVKENTSSIMNNTLESFQKLGERAKRIALNADIVVDNYAFTPTADKAHTWVVDIGDLSKSLLLTAKGKVLKTSMNAREVATVLKYYKRNSVFLSNAPVRLSVARH